MSAFLDFARNERVWGKRHDGADTMTPLPPDVRARLRRVQLRARRASGADGVGAHASRSRGSGLEFAQYRAYEPGDEPRQIDWKLYARSDKFFVREAERESPIAVWLLIDASASMAQADGDRPDWLRLDAARAIALAVAEVALQQGDRFGWMVLHEDGLRVVTPAAGRRQRDRLLVELGAVVAGRGFPDAAVLAPLWDRIGARDLVIGLSDWFDDAAVALLERLAAARRDVMAVQLLTVEEREFPFAGGYRFRDPESGAELLGDAAGLRADFLARFGAARAALATRFAAAGVGFATHWLDEPVDRPLAALFA